MYSQQFTASQLFEVFAHLCACFCMQYLVGDVRFDTGATRLAKSATIVARRLSDFTRARVISA